MNCAFGFKIRDNCEICECSCVNEDNYFQEIQKSYQLESLKSKTSQFCKISCILGIFFLNIQQLDYFTKFQLTFKKCIGYSKDDFGCFKCLCIEESFLKSTQAIEITKLTSKPTFLASSSTTKITTPATTTAQTTTTKDPSCDVRFIFYT